MMWEMSKGVTKMECCDLGTFLDALVCGTDLHISVVFTGKPGSEIMQRPYHHVVHKKPVCAAMRKLPDGYSSCVRCRMAAQKYVSRHGRPLAGYCQKGVYEYCAPVIWRGETVAVTFIGNIYTGEAEQLKRFGSRLTPELLETMERKYTREDCVRTARVVSDFICLLADRFGMGEVDHDKLTDSVKSYIRENFSYNFSLTDLAELFGYNAKYLGRVFKSRTGTTINAYCNALRIGEAKRLLKETEMRITEIALETGFNNISYFNYVFVRQTGVSPSVYRSAQGENPL